MTTSLQSLTDVKIQMIFKLTFENWTTTPGGTPAQQIFRFSDSTITFTDASTSEVYEPFGDVLSISGVSTSVRNTDNSFSFVLNGLDDTFLKGFLNSDVRGGDVRIWRVFLQPGTNTIISDLDNPIGTGGTTGFFHGYISSYNINETYSVYENSSSTTITVDCNSYSSVFQNLTKGIRTNPKDLRYLTRNAAAGPDASFDRVPSLKDSTFVFGGSK